MGAAWKRDGRGSKRIHTLWGDVSTPVQRWRHAATDQTATTLIDPDLDGSGWTQQALCRVIDLGLRLPFEEASETLRPFGPPVSSAELARLLEGYGKDAEQHVKNSLRMLELAPLEAPTDKIGRVMVFQADGVYVLGRESQSAAQGGGIEIKTALVYPQSTPQQRTRVACVCTASEFLPLCSGLLRQAGVQLQDTLVAVTDGAPWLASLCETMGVHLHILDVYHSSSYLEVVMVALGWSAQRRDEEHRAWVQGVWCGSEWLKIHLPEEMNPEWSSEVKVAVSYLKSRTHMMDYPSYRDRGFPIGSGQIEGMNKQVIGGRMKGSGMRWSRPGAHRMATMRAQLFSRSPLVSVPLRRHAAFPRPTPKS